MNKSTLSAIVCVTLVAVIAACRPAATPMAIPTDTPTLVPPTATPLPTATPMPAAIPSSTLVPTSTPLPTATPVPPTPTPSPLPPTLTPTMVPATPDVGLDAETALAILPSAGELGVDGLESEGFIVPDEGEGFGDLPLFRVYNPVQNIMVDLMVFADADDAARFAGEQLSDYESMGYTPAWTDLGDESFALQGEVLVRVDRCILWALGEANLEQLRPSIQRLQAFVSTATRTPSVVCEREAWGWFEGALEMVPGLREEIGCPVEEYHVLTAISQDFQRGYMVWREEKNLIYVFYEGDGWESYSDRWQEGMPELDPSFGPPPEGVLQPKRGFGLVWQEHPEVREGLGWAFNEERACDEAHLQEFHWGLMLECTQFVMPKQKTRIFILFDDGTYDIYMPL